MGEYYRITSWPEEFECPVCGFPVGVGDYAYESDDNYCSKTCAFWQRGAETDDETDYVECECCRRWLDATEAHWRESFDGCAVALCDDCDEPPVGGYDGEE